MGLDPVCYARSAWWRVYIIHILGPRVPFASFCRGQVCNKVYWGSNVFDKPLQQLSMLNKEKQRCCSCSCSCNKIYFIWYSMHYISNQNSILWLEFIFLIGLSASNTFAKIFDHIWKTLFSLVFSRFFKVLSNTSCFLIPEE